MTSAAIVFIGLIVVYGFVLDRYVPTRLHFAANLVASLLAVAYGLLHSLSLDDMGLGLHFALKGLLVAGLCSLGIMVAAGLFTLLMPVKHAALLPKVFRPGKIAYETAVRVPLSTALSEEILFRGVLLAVLLQQAATLPSVLICSIVFGLWHMLPRGRSDTKAAIVPIVVATAVAGAFFCWLRLLSDSLVAPWLVHWSINASALLAMHFILKKKHDFR